MFEKLKNKTIEIKYVKRKPLTKLSMQIGDQS